MRESRKILSAASQATGRFPKVLFSLGREDDLDRDAVKRLVASLARLLEPGEALASTAAGDLEFVSSVPFGGTYVLDHLWRRLKIDRIVGQVGQPKRGRRRDMSVTERVLYSLEQQRLEKRLSGALTPVRAGQAPDS